MCKFFLEKYEWYALLIAILGDILIPFILAPFYRGYNHTSMTISALVYCIIDI